MSVNLKSIRQTLANTIEIIDNFNYVDNSPTQFFQRNSFQAITATVKMLGRKTPYKVAIAAGETCPAVHPKTGERGRHSARVYMNLLLGHKIRDKTTIANHHAMLVWCAAKIVTSRARSLEGALMSLAFNSLELKTGKLSELIISKTVHSRDDILAKRDGLLLNLEVGVAAGTITPKVGKSKNQLESDITL